MNAKSPADRVIEYKLRSATSHYQHSTKYCQMLYQIIAVSAIAQVYAVPASNGFGFGSNLGGWNNFGGSGGFFNNPFLQQQPQQTPPKQQQQSPRQQQQPSKQQASKQQPSPIPTPLPAQQQANRNGGQTASQQRDSQKASTQPSSKGSAASSSTGGSSMDFTAYKNTIRNLNCIRAGNKGPACNDGGAHPDPGAWHVNGNPTTACGTSALEEEIIGIHKEIFGAQTGGYASTNFCGKKIKVTNPATGKSITGVIKERISQVNTYSYSQSQRPI